METFDTHTGHNFLTKDKVTATTAHAVMDEAGALENRSGVLQQWTDFEKVAKYTLLKLMFN